MARVSISRTLGVPGTFGTSAKCGLELLGLRPNGLSDFGSSWNFWDFGQMKVLRRKVALEIHRSQIFLYSYPAELINADSTSQKPTAIAGWKKSSVAWGIGV